MLLLPLLGIIITGAVATTLLPLDAQCGPTVKTKNGTYGGAYLPTYDQDVFLGIRYAQVSNIISPTPSKSLIYYRKSTVSLVRSLSMRHGTMYFQ
jgi:hypothetical protein